MRLYHFTSADIVRAIRLEGIKPSYIRVPRVGQSAHPVVSLTGNPDPSPLLYKSLWDDSELSGEALAGWEIDNPGDEPPAPRNTSACRIHLEIPVDDPKLYMMLFPDIGALGFQSQDHINEFVALGGGMSDEWRIYLGTVPPEYIVDVDGECP